MGATLGQGWYYARPADLPSELPAGQASIPVADPSVHILDATPYRAVQARREIRRGNKRLLLAISHLLEDQAAALGPEGVIVSAFQDASRFTPATHRRYTTLAGDAAFVGALGVGLEGEPAPGVRGASLNDEDPLLGEWSVAVLGPHFAAALVAVDLGHGDPDIEREFDFALTYDRDLVIKAVNSLMRRVLPLGSEAGVLIGA